MGLIKRDMSCRLQASCCEVPLTQLSPGSTLSQEGRSLSVHLGLSRSETAEGRCRIHLEMYSLCGSKLVRAVRIPV